MGGAVASNKLGHFYRKIDDNIVIHIRCAKTQQNQFFADHLARCTGCLTTCGPQFGLPYEIKVEKPSVLLLIDCFNMGADRVWSTIGLCSQNGGKQIKIAFFNVSSDLSTKIETTAMDRGICGIFNEGAPLDMLIKGLKAILKGEYWYPHSVINQYIKIKSSQHLLQPNVTLPLTHREKEILQLLTGGDSNSDIADKLCLSVHTVKSHIYNLYKKIEVPNRLQAVLWAARHTP